ncbi:uncharacterized protein BDZ99DRAFT_466165 [Mytilinidion resinicola]|uniref:Uncharacterized protein n=1 Tax=Mytilinidion resinicola TaxID=574789 RepID=A0A6A6YB55_9PEZI|nr:uncharacterized protein BDZ99DRAFT_466165 [Mytilinidion resinicola]KAF2805808.1 hypothetical protein BDZ99DRAFT_466165 [Mytilinidion resinicola]
MYRTLGFDLMKLWIASCALQLTSVPASLPQTCYRLDSSPYPDDRVPYLNGSIPRWVSCNPDQAISHCCQAFDLCLDNGLCRGFQAGGDQVLELEGCTDAAWRPPCPQYFADSRYGTLGADVRVLIWACSYDSDGEYCVGSTDPGGVSIWDASCCADASKRIRTIPPFKSMHMAGDVTKRIEMWQGSRANTVSNGDNSSSGSSNDWGMSNKIAFGAGIVAVAGVL